jgi:3-oxoacyl-[acyl-carrier protein] reductase
MRTAIVTAATSGIGIAIVDRLSRAGFAVMANYYDPQEEGYELPLPACEGRGPVASRWGDMTRADHAEALVAATLEEFGRLDVVVNNAGGGEVCPFDQMTPADWHRLLDVNLTSAFLVCRAALGPMQRRSSGRIVNIASQQAFKGAAGLVHYCAAKAGVVGMTRALAHELAPHGITVNAVAPGPIETEGHRRAGVTPEQLRRQAAGLPLKRLGRPVEVAESVLFLADSPSGDFYTGQTLHVNGGDVMP